MSNISYPKFKSVETISTNHGLLRCIAEDTTKYFTSKYGVFKISSVDNPNVLPLFAMTFKPMHGRDAEQEFPALTWDDLTNTIYQIIESQWEKFG